MTSSYSSREQIEVDFWRDAPLEKPGVESLHNQLDKSCDALLLATAFEELGLPRKSDVRCLEIGGGQGWGACVLKRLNPAATVTASDISEYAVASVPRWERIYNVNIDRTFACKSHEIPCKDGELDFVFCFAAAHHFANHDATFAELSRVLRPNGVVAYIYEPTTPKLLHSWAHRRVNAKRPDVPEDVLVPSELKRMAAGHGLQCEVHYWPTTLKRTGLAAPYYTMLSCVPLLCRMLPCTANIIFTKSR